MSTITLVMYSSTITLLCTRVRLLKKYSSTSTEYDYSKSTRTRVRVQSTITPSLYYCIRVPGNIGWSGRIIMFRDTLKLSTPVDEKLHLDSTV